MSFDAGSIKGSLDLDTTSFEKGFRDAHTHAQTHGGKIREVLESLTSVFEEALGPAVGRFANGLQSVFAGFSEGPIIGSLGAIATALGAVREAVQDTGERFHQFGLEAEKAGVSAEFLSRLSGVAGTVGIGIEQLGQSFKLLEVQVEEAQAGSKTAEDGFARLGISMQQAGELAKDPQALFEATTAALGRMTSASDRQIASRELLGRQGANLIPLFAMGREEFNRTAATIERLSGGVTAADAKMGASFGLLEAYVKAAFEGVQKAVSRPVLAFLESHMNVIVPKLEAMVDSLVSTIGSAWSMIEGSFDMVSPVFDALAMAVKPVIAMITTLFHVFGQAAGVGAASILIKGLGAALIGLLAPLGAIAAPIGAFIAQSIALGFAVEALTAPFGGVSAVISEVSQIFHDVFVVVLAAVEWGIKKVYDRLMEVAQGPFKPGIDALVSAFVRMRDAIQYTIEKVKLLLDMLHELAGTPNLFGTDVNAPGPQAGATPTNAQQPDYAGGTLTRGSGRLGRSFDGPPGDEGDPYTAPPPPPPLPAPQRSAGSRGRGRAAAAPSGAPILDIDPADFVSPNYVAPPDAAQRDRSFRSRLNDMEGSLTEAQLGPDGLFRGRGISGGGRSNSAALQPDQQEALRAAEVDRQRQTDSITEWRKTHPKVDHHSMDDAFSSLHGRVSDASRSAVGGSLTVNQYVSVYPKFDTRDAVNQLAGKLLPEMMKAKTQLDQRFASDETADQVRASIGGEH